MTVTSTQVLPAAPAAGKLKYTPLGGNGFSAPHAAWEVHLELAGDASGGQMKLVVEMDDRYCSLLSWVNIQATQTTPADVEGLLNIGEMAQRFDLLSVDVGSGSNIAELYKPPPLILPGGSLQILQFRTDNVDNTTFNLKTYCLLFNIAVREKFPLGPLLWATGST